MTRHNPFLFLMTDPRHLYSGGEEGAILKWDTRESRKIVMVPRLGAAVVFVAATEEAVAVSTEHNTIKMFTSNLQEMAVSDSVSKVRLYTRFVFKE